MRIGYEDTDKKIKIEIYGLEFEIKNIDVKREIDKEDINVIENEIDNILGDGAVEKINNKRMQDGYSKMDLGIELNILGFIFSTYADSMTNGFMRNINNTVERLNNQVNKLGNRNQRRYYKRNRRY